MPKQRYDGRTAAHGLPVIDLHDIRFAEDPYRLLAEVRERSPLAVSQSGLEVLDYASCHRLARDQRLVTDHMGLISATALRDPEVLRYKSRSMVSVHGAEHARLRAPLVRQFTRPRAAALRDDVVEVVREVLSHLDAGGPNVDLFSDLCCAVPARLYCRWTSSPASDVDVVGRISRDGLQVFHEDEACKESIVRAHHEMFAYVRRQIRQRRQSDRRGDLLDDLIETCDRFGFSETELEDEACVLLEASIDNTVHQMALVLKCLLERPTVWRKLSMAPDLIPTAVREALRMESRTRSIDRMTRIPIDLHGYEVAAGERISLRIMAAQRDPEAYSFPDTFRFDRPDSPGVLVFGGGPSSCLGMHIAVAEIEEVLRELFDAFERVTLSHPVDVTSSAFLYDVNAIPVTVTRRHVQAVERGQ